MRESRSTVRLVAALAAGILLLAVVVGNAVAGVAAERSGAAMAVDAVVVGTASATGDAAGRDGSRWARVAWSDGPGAANGAASASTLVATVRVPTGTRAGDVRRLWVAPDGTVVPRPDTGSGPWVASLLTVVVGGAACVPVVAARRAAWRRAVDRELAAEWARVEPVWTGRVA